jgi:hypothetical protein
MLVNYELSWACVIATRDLSKDLVALLNLWPNWHKLTKSSFGMKHNSNFLKKLKA